jgi:hypothetical protein
MPGVVAPIMRHLKKAMELIRSAEVEALLGDDGEAPMLRDGRLQGADLVFNVQFGQIVR